MNSGLIPLIHRLEEVFNRLGLPHSYGGAIAYNFYAPPRFTQDIDLLILVPAVKAPRLAEELSDLGCVQDLDQPGPLLTEQVWRQLRDKPFLCVLYCTGIRVELFTPWHSFHHSVLERSPERDLEGVRIRVHAPEDLIVFKKVFDRPKDISDIKALLLSQKGRLDLAQIRANACLFLSSESLQELDHLLNSFS